MKKTLIKVFSILLILVVSFSCFGGCSGSEEIKNVIIIIGDGMGLEHIKAGQIYEGREYSFTKWHNTLVNTDSLGDDGNYVLTDSAASGTAMATGQLTKNGYVGMSVLGDEFETIMDKAKKVGKTTAIVTTDDIFGATPSAFSAHSMNRANTTEIINSQIKTSNVDLLCGAYTAETIGDNVRELVEQNGYAFCKRFADLATTTSSNKAYWQVSIGGVYASESLSSVTKKALEFVSKDQDGFVMMIEQAHVDKYSHGGEFENAIKSVQSLNDTVDAVMEWIGNRKDTAVLVTADHETGGLSVSENENTYKRVQRTLDNKTFSWQYITGDHTRSKVGLFVYGIKPKFESFTSFSENAIKNVEIYRIVSSLLEDPLVYSQKG